MAGLDPSTGARLGLAFGERAVRGFDVTCSAPKSVSVLWAVGDAQVRREVLAAHDAAVGAMVGWIESHADTRYRLAARSWWWMRRGSWRRGSVSTRRGRSTRSCTGLPPEPWRVADSWWILVVTGLGGDRVVQAA